MRKRRVVVLYGGKADEHSISCISAAGVLRAMDAERFEPIPVGITKAGEWVVSGTNPRDFDLTNGAMPTVDGPDVDNMAKPVVLDMSCGNNGFYVREKDDTLNPLGFVDVVFPVLHGPYGEDGAVQGLLEMMGVPYVGCGVFSSAACMDKAFTKALLLQAGIPVAPGVTVETRDFAESGTVGSSPFDSQTEAVPSAFVRGAQEVMNNLRAAKLRYPLFVKPSRAGSSFGVSKLEHDGDVDELAAALFEASKHDWKVLVEQGIEGREIECAVFSPAIDREPVSALPGEIVLDHRATGGDQFYDFNSKYTDSEASHVEVPANLPDDTLKRLQEVAVRAFKAVDGAGLSRVDTFVTSSGEMMVNEINTMPGFTPISMYPKAWDATGVSYSDLITRLVEGALR
ncbi:D-alanine-D-alanine ligase [Bifidobacterium commune]|uniref:D-alanine--D-alanine ligase n=1 Tax=Bifidobacterium commune TaxID=1505727 RepID=A0A1C4H7L7_9BIFI|nr:D-alanine--D-alanine ligase family protein [Bifidobacterium commune]MBB2955578.1 D-alanine-D-alanine ligase [Bifidobacterium commune]SCC80658.1 D-alanine-D-alanine ligase [Bifidobacterium commune]